MERNAVVFPGIGWKPSATPTPTPTRSARSARSRPSATPTRKRRTSTRLSSGSPPNTPVLEDTGVKDAVRAPSPENGQGLLAARFPGVRFGRIQEAMRDPAKQKLLVRKEQIEQAIDKLKYEKAAMPAGRLPQELSALLVELAHSGGTGTVMRLLALFLAAAPLPARPTSAGNCANSAAKLRSRGLLQKIADSPVRRKWPKASGAWANSKRPARPSASQSPGAENPDIRVRWGRLLLERFNVTESSQLFQEALELRRTTPPRCWASPSPSAKASTAAPSTSPGRPSKAIRSCSKPRNCVAALVLEDGDFEKAREEADKALALSKTALDAMAVHAAIDLLTDKPESPWLKKDARRQPGLWRGLRAYRALVCAEPALRRGNHALSQSYRARSRNCGARAPNWAST
jgi:hypothetical protein